MRLRLSFSKLFNHPQIYSSAKTHHIAIRTAAPSTRAYLLLNVLLAILNFQSSSAAHSDANLEANPSAEITSAPALVTHASARVYYALRLTNSWQEDAPDLQQSSPQSLLRQLAKLTETSGIPEERLQHYVFDIKAHARDIEQLRFAVAKHDPGKAEGAASGKFSRVLKTSASVQKQIEQCTRDGFEVKDCCSALLLPWSAFSSRWRAHRGFRAAFSERLGAGPNAPASPTRLSDWARSAADSLHSQHSPGPSKHSGWLSALGTDAWLTRCSQAYGPNMNTLSDLKQAFGDYHRDWPSYSQPVSQAKRMGRRFYYGPGITVAETIYVGPKSADAGLLWTPRESKQGDATVEDNTRDRKGLLRMLSANKLNLGLPECSVRETEVIVRRPGGQLQFYAFDHLGVSSVVSMFADTAMNTERALAVPFSCMGCHFNPNTLLIDNSTPDPVAIGIGAALATPLAEVRAREHELQHDPSSLSNIAMLSTRVHSKDLEWGKRSANLRPGPQLYRNATHCF